MTLIILKALRQYAIEQQEISTPGENVSEDIENLTNNFPALRDPFMDSYGNFRRFVGDEDMR
ncbi:MAG TPA: hypothetical protein DCE41_29870 [Cytophagales bacterium]|nr:hypothetical protein [Cytophagales bacterium]